MMQNLLLAHGQVRFLALHRKKFGHPWCSWTMFDYKSVKDCFGVILCILYKVSVSLVLRGFSPGVIHGSSRRMWSVLNPLSWDQTLSAVILGGPEPCHHWPNQSNFDNVFQLGSSLRSLQGHKVLSGGFCWLA